MNYHEEEFLSGSTVTIWGWIILLWGRLVRCRMSNSFPVFYPLDVSSSPHPQS